MEILETGAIVTMIRWEKMLKDEVTVSRIFLAYITEDRKRDYIITAL